MKINYKKYELYTDYFAWNIIVYQVQNLQKEIRKEFQIWGWEFDTPTQKTNFFSSIARKSFTVDR